MHWTPKPDRPHPADLPISALYEVFAAETRGGAVRAALNWLMEAGFSRVRFYALAEPPFTFEGDPDPGSPKLVLVDLRPRHDDMMPGQSAWPVSGSLLGPDPGSWTRPVARLGETMSTRRAEPLDLAGSVVVNVPVRDGTASVGMLAADWHGAEHDLDAADGDALLLLGTTLATRYRRDVATRFAALRLPEPESDEWIPRVTSELRRALRAGAACAFRYDWIEGRLTQVPGSFDCAPRFELPTVQLKESYAVGEFVTGAAWVDPRNRYPAKLVQPESRKWHEELFDGELHTVLYERLGKRDARYLLRFINRDDSPKLPFFSDRLLLHQACDGLSAVLDSQYALRVTRAINRLVEATAGHLDNVKLRDAVGRALAEFGVKTWALLGTRSDGVIDTFADSGIVDADPTGAQSGWPGSIEMLLDEEPVEEAEPVSSHTFLIELTARHGVATDDLLERGFTHLLCFRAILVDVSVGLVIPIRRTTQGARLSRLAGELREQIPHTLDSVELIVELLARATVDRRFDLARTAGLNIVRYLQHEIGTSVLSLVTEATNSLQAAANAIVGTPRGERIPDTTVWRIREDRARLNSMLNSAARTFGVANFALGADQFLQLQMADVAVLDLVRDAVAGVRTRFPDLLRHQFDIAPFVVDYDEKRIADLGSVCVDLACLTPAIVALLDNAVKYSIRRHPPDPVSVDLRLRRDGNRLYVAVSNWGLPIPESRRAVVFEPFTRGGYRHYRRPVPGLGIGLFLARQIARSHKGDVELRHNKPTLSDPRRRHSEGFDTCFELWVRSDLEPGTVNWSPEPVGT